MRQYGETAADYVRRQRIPHAHALLDNSDVPVQRIALQVGYQHHSTFTATFVKHFGRSPKLFRQRLPKTDP